MPNIYILYGQTKGRDCVRKVNTKVEAKHPETLQFALGITASVAEKKAKETQDKEE